jgi:hypothetical protein
MALTLGGGIAFKMSNKVNIALSTNSHLLSLATICLMRGVEVMVQDLPMTIIMDSPVSV